LAIPCSPAPPVSNGAVVVILRRGSAPSQRDWAAFYRIDRTKIAAKLAKSKSPGRNLRIFETSDPNLLLVKEKDLRGNHEYAIERDEGLVADLKLYAQAPQ
jgi:hypothetical protein